MMPLLAETLVLSALFYLIGVGLAWVLFGRGAAGER
jgi:hypothetical protein